MKKIIVIFMIFLISLLFYTPTNNFSSSVIQNLFCKVDIKGEVLRPRIYEVPKDTSYFEASKLAGLTRYSVIIDEEKRIIKDTNLFVQKRIGDININQAPLKELTKLPKIGIERALKIIDYRKNKKIQNWKEFSLVVNIKDEKTINNIKMYAYIR